MFRSDSNSDMLTHPAQREAVLGPGGCTVFRSDSNIDSNISDMLIHPAPGGGGGRLMHQLQQQAVPDGLVGSAGLAGFGTGQILKLQSLWRIPSATVRRPACHLALRVEEGLASKAG